MVCPTCSAPLPETGLQCPECGAAVGWYIGKPNGQVYGPLDRRTLDQCIREARLVAGDTVRLGEEGDFVPAHEVLSQGLAPPPAPAASRPASYAGPAVAAGGGGAAIAKGCAIAVGICVALGLLLFLLSIPIVRKSKAASTQSSCSSNLRQSALACLMYAADYDDHLPRDTDWEAVIYPYVKNRSIFVCPAAKNEKGYVRNPRLSDVEMNTIARPAECLLMWDAGAPVPGTTVPVGCTSPRHGTYDNFSFTDGHMGAQTSVGSVVHIDPAGPGASP